jgi:hypothetical protein
MKQNMKRDKKMLWRRNGGRNVKKKYGRQRQSIGRKQGTVADVMIGEPKIS